MAQAEAALFHHLEQVLQQDEERKCVELDTHEASSGSRTVVVTELFRSYQC